MGEVGNCSRILLYSDLHLHTWRQGGSTPGELPARLLQQISILDQIHEINRSRNIHLNIFGGDWVHRQGEHPTEVLYATQQYFAKDRTPVLFCDGNHDLISLTDPHEYHKITGIIREYGARIAGGNMLHTVSGRSYTTVYGRIMLVYYQDKIDYGEIKGYDIVVLHKQPSLTNEYGHQIEGADWRTLAQNNRFVFFGHDHTMRKLADNCFVIGAPMHLNFGDSGDRGVYILDMGTGAVEFIKLRYPDFISVDTEDQIKPGDDYNYYRVLHPTKKLMSANVISVDTPPVFESRIKSNDFNEVLGEWLTINEKEDKAKYLDVLSDIVVHKMQMAKTFFTGRIKSVYGENFLSLGKVEYTLHNGLTFIAGSGDDKSVGASNGAGKTTATGEIVLWTLFEKTTKGLTGDDVIRNRPDQQKDCTGRVVLENIDGSNQFMTIVERSRKNGLSVLVNGEDLVKGLRRPDRQKYLEEQILGFNESVFRAACYFSQKDLTMLTGMTDGDRTDMITALLGFEEYDDMYIKTVDKQKMLLKDIEQKRGEQACDDNTLSGVAGKLSVLLDIIHDQEAEAKKARLESDVAEKNVQAARVELQKAKAETKFFDTEDYTHAADDLSEKETTLRNLVVDVDNKIDTSDLPQEISLTQTDLRMAERAVKELGAQTEQYKQDVAFTQLPNAEAIAEARRAADKYRAQAESYQRTNNAVQAEIDRVRSLQQGQCANCGAPITGDSIKALLTGKEQALAIGVETMRGLDEQARAAQAQAKIMIETGRKELIESTLRRLNDKNVEKEKLASRLRDLSNTLAGLEREREAYQQKLQDIRNAKDELAKRRAENDRRAREAERKAADLQSKVKEYESRKDYYDSVIVKAKDYIEQTRKQTGLLEEEKAAIKTRIKEAERAVLRANESVERLEFWKTGFSSKGIRSVLLDRFCNEFNFLVNKHLTMTSAGAMSIVVSPTSETKGGELRNKIGLAIKIGGMVSVYEALSGGEQRRVDIALCLALNEWVSLKYNMPYGLLGVIVMDELFSDLDKTGEESVASVLAEESKKRAIIIISHTGEMASHADRVWLVSKKDHVSSLCVNEEV